MQKIKRLIYTFALGALAGAAQAGTAVTVPEPGILALLGVAGIGIAFAVIYKRRK